MLDFANAVAAFPAFIVLDINLPRLNGSNGKPPSPASRSCRDSLLDRLKGGLARATAYLAKPFRVELVVATVQRLLARGVLVKEQ